MPQENKRTSSRKDPAKQLTDLANKHLRTAEIMRETAELIRKHHDELQKGNRPKLPEITEEETKKLNKRGIKAHNISPSKTSVAATFLNSFLFHMKSPGIAFTLPIFLWSINADIKNSENREIFSVNPAKSIARQIIQAQPWRRGKRKEYFKEAIQALEAEHQTQKGHYKFLLETAEKIK